MRWFILNLFWLTVYGFGYAQPQTVSTVDPRTLHPIDSAYRAAIASHDTLKLAEACYLYGKRYSGAGQRTIAKTWYIRSLRLLDKRGDSYEYGRLYLRLAELELDQWNPKQSLPYARQSLAIFTRINHYKGMSSASCMLARAYLGGYETVDQPGPNQILTQPDSAFAYLQRAEQWAKQTEDRLLQADIADLTAKALLQKRDKRAIDYLKKSLQIHQQKSASGTQLRAMLSLSESYLTFKLLPQARALIDSLKQRYVSELQANYRDQQQFERMEAAYFKAIGNWQQAYWHQQQAQAIERAGLIADRDGILSRLSVEYETEKREARIQAQTRELTQRNRFLAMLGCLLVLLAALSLFFFRLYRQNKRINRRNIELVQEQNHRVKNNLQVVSSLLNMYAHRLSDPLSRKAVEESQLRVEAMALLQRQLYDRQHLARLNLTEFIPDLVRGVLQSYGYDWLQPHFDLNFYEVSADEALSIGLILNELTTNACKYAFPKTEHPTFRVSAQTTNNILTMSVADNGPGMANQPAHPDSFGLRLIQMQVEQLRGSAQWATNQGTQFIGTFHLKQ